MVGDRKIPVLAQRDPKNLPWSKLGIDVVVESTGLFRTQELAAQHLTAGAKRVVISAPAKGGDVPTYVLGVNHDGLKKEKAAVLNNASCTTNCVTPMLAILDEAFGVKKAMMTTAHGYTADQNLVDGPHKDLRRARSAAENIVPTSSGAAEAVAATIPALKNKFDGYALRVPVSTVSISDVTAVLKKRVTVEEVNAAIIKACKSPRWKNIVAYTQEELVSRDFIQHPASAIFDLPLTKVVDGDLVKIVAWYDNEWGYSMRLVELCIKLAK
jgi:glyceraldehyde 3-phosphate dehydrogenase